MTIRLLERSRAGRSAAGPDGLGERLPVLCNAASNQTEWSAVVWDERWAGSGPQRAPHFGGTSIFVLDDTLGQSAETPTFECGKYLFDNKSPILEVEILR
jgi:hypothetical protein